MKRKNQSMSKEELMKQQRVPPGYFRGVNWTREELMPMSDVAEIWARKKGIRVPKDRRTKEWKKMYLRWHEYAFEDFGK